MAEQTKKRLMTTDEETGAADNEIVHFPDYAYILYIFNAGLSLVMEYFYSVVLVLLLK